MMLKSLTAALLASSALALDMKIESVTCESRAIRAEFSYICSGDFLCTFGDEESLEGQCKRDE
jgi:hypothetical protein